MIATTSDNPVTEGDWFSWLIPTGTSVLSIPCDEQTDRFTHLTEVHRLFDTYAAVYWQSGGYAVQYFDQQYRPVGKTHRKRGLLEARAHIAKRSLR